MPTGLQRGLVWLTEPIDPRAKGSIRFGTRTRPMHPLRRRYVRADRREVVVIYDPFPKKIMRQRRAKRAL